MKIIWLVLCFLWILLMFSYCLIFYEFLYIYLKKYGKMRWRKGEDEMKDRYELKKQHAEKEKKEREKLSTIIANFRLAVFLVLIFCIVKGYRGDSVLYNSLATVSFLTFIFLVAIHHRVKEKIQLLEMLVQVNDRYLKRISGQWVDFEDVGEEFMDKEHPYANDLDVFGKYSMFQLLNLTNTETGRHIFANNLTNPSKVPEEIEARKEAIEELSGMHDFVQRLEAISAINAKNLKSPEKLIQYAESDQKIFSSNGVKWLMRGLSILTIVALLSLIWTPRFRFFALGLLVIQIALWIIGILKNQEALSIVNYLKYNLETYSEMLKTIKPMTFKSAKLQQLKELMFRDEKSSLRAISELSIITELVNARIQGIMNILLNIFFLWDYQCVFLLETWKKKYGKEVKNWVHGIGEIEALMSFSQIPNVIKDTAHPKLSPTGHFVEAELLGHPLIANEKRVSNDVVMKDEIFVITGSNMSGKTTFLRTIGVNLILAYNGARCVCKSMNVGILDIYTSMRIVDDLGSGISTFYAEILRIKKIIDRAEQDSNMLFLIDEIFRGTNSVDRITGAKNVIANLLKDGVIGAVSTHDLELCALDNGKNIRNYHFDDTYDGESIRFDYKIKQGRSTSTNAKNLMKLAGIPMIIKE